MEHIDSGIFLMLTGMKGNVSKSRGAVGQLYDSTGGSLGDWKQAVCRSTTAALSSLQHNIEWLNNKNFSSHSREVHSGVKLSPGKVSLEHSGKNLFLVFLSSFHGLLTFFGLWVHHSNLHFHLHIVFHFVTVSKFCPIILRPPAILIWPHPLPYFIMKNHFHMRWPCEVSNIASVGQRDTVQQTRRRCVHLERMF